MCRRTPLRPTFRFITSFIINILLACQINSIAEAGGAASKCPMVKELAAPQEAIYVGLQDKTYEPEKKLGMGEQLKKKENSHPAQAERLLALLRQHGIQMHDWVISLDAIESFEQLKEGLEAYVGRSFKQIPSDEAIVKQLTLLLENVRAMELTPEEIKLLATDGYLEQAESFYSVSAEKQRKKVPVINYQKKLNKLKSERSFNSRFYEYLYKALSTDDVVLSSEYPDESDRRLNQLPREETLKNRRNRLIIFLASIKDPSKPYEISRSIKADLSELVPFSTRGNSASWFHEKRYKLYRIYQQLPNLSREDKGILLSSFLHAGQHCSVAKRFQIEQSYKRFAHDDALEIDKELVATGQGLEGLIEIELGALKYQILDKLTRTVLEREKQHSRLYGEGRFGLGEFDIEEVTFLDATFDTYAENFGLEKRDCPYMSYKLKIGAEDALGQGGYRVKNIVQTVKRGLADRIKSELAGDLHHVMKDPDLLLMGYLKQKRFILPPGSQLASASWGDHNAPVNNLRPEPARHQTQPIRPPSLAAQVGGMLNHRPYSPRSRSIVEGLQVTENGLMPERLQFELQLHIQDALASMSQGHYEDIIRNPHLAVDDLERLASLSAREVFILVDRSGSMNSVDQNPTRSPQGNWTRWDTASIATQSIAQTVLSMDEDAVVNVMLWDGDRFESLGARFEIFRDSSDIKRFFEDNRPNRGSTPLAEALDKVYDDHLRKLLNYSEPFTCIIITDGAPNNPNKVKDFFKKIVVENSLESPGREFLAAFSFVRIGDDHGAIQFLQDLDDNLIYQLRLNVDIVDTVEDNFLFGTGRYQNRKGVGPLGLLWNAVLD